MSPSTQSSASVARRWIRGCAIAILYALPLAASLGLLLLVTNAYMDCSGSEVLATSKRLRQFVWLFALPVLTYTAVTLSYLRWGSTTVAAHALRVVVCTGAVGAVYLYLNVRYFTLTQRSCADGLPGWWPAWLPAR